MSIAWYYRFYKNDPLYRWASGNAHLRWRPTLTEQDPNPPFPLEDPTGGTPQTINGVQVSHTWTVVVGAIVAGAVTIASAAAPSFSTGVTAGQAHRTVPGQEVSHTLVVTAGQAHRTVPGQEASQAFSVATGQAHRTVPGQEAAHTWVVAEGTVQAEGPTPQTITGVPVHHTFAVDNGTVSSPVTIAGVPVAHQFAVQGGSVLSPVTIEGQATGHTWVVAEGTVETTGPQTIVGVPVEFGFRVDTGTVVVQSTSPETLPLGGGGVVDDRLLVRRNVIDLRSRQVSFRASGGVRVHGTAPTFTRSGDLEPLPFNPIRIPRIPEYTAPAPPAAPAPPSQTISSSSVPVFVLPRSSKHVGMGGIRVSGEAQSLAIQVRWNTKGKQTRPSRHRAVVGLGGVLISGAATVTPVSWHKALLRDDDDAIQLLLEADAI